MDGAEEPTINDFYEKIENFEYVLKDQPKSTTFISYQR